MKLLRNKRGFTQLLRARAGFTLLEVLIVIVILGVIAGLAVPIYSSQVERARAQEALMNLGALRESAQRFYSSFNSYTPTAPGTMTIRANAAAAAATNLDTDPNNPAGGVNRLFDYTFSTAPTATTYTMQALRRTGVPNVADAGGTAANNWVQINEAGVVTRNGVYA